ncbi:hypothetical protein OROHE_020506 [Orobanche hederae]
MINCIYSPIIVVNNQGIELYLPTIPSPPPSLPALPVIPGQANEGGGGAGCQVWYAGCKMILTVGGGLTDFVCPKCCLLQMLPPELLQHRISNSSSSSAAHDIDPTKIQLPCAHCKAILNVPHGLSRFNCPQCGIALAVDLSKIRHLFPLPPPPPTPPQYLLPPPPEEEVNEVAVQVEREEDEGGTAGETFTDYCPPKLSIGPHPDPVVETSSLSAVQPPEPTYSLAIKDDLETSKILSYIFSTFQVVQGQDFFVGDGDGVGKGRTIAGLIWENWHHRRRKSLWISVGSDLKFDARRGLDDVGAS